MLRPPAPRMTKSDFIAMLKSRPDHAFVTSSYIAVWHEGLQTAIMIPGDFSQVTDQQANEILQENLIKINQLSTD